MTLPIVSDIERLGVGKLRSGSRNTRSGRKCVGADWALKVENFFTLQFKTYRSGQAAFT